MLASILAASTLAGQSRDLIVSALVYSLVSGGTEHPHESMRNAYQAQVPTPEDEDPVDPRLWFYALCQRVNSRAGREIAARPRYKLLRGKAQAGLHA